MAAVLSVQPVLGISNEGQGGVPVVTALEPVSARPGEVVVATGEYLDKTRAEGLFLTAGDVDTRVHVVDQGPSFIKFKIPDGVAPARYKLTVLMAGPEPTLLDEPVTLTVVKQQ